MKQVILMISMFFFFNSRIKQDPVIKFSIKKTFEIWNQKTISSIKNQLLKTKDSRRKTVLQNHLDVVQSSLYSTTDTDEGLTDKGQPSRYKFLQTIYGIMKTNKDYFVVETIHEGEVVLEINYLIENSTHGSEIIIYHYLRNNWKKVRDTTIATVNLHSESYGNNEIDQLSGNNESPIIISEFEPSKIESHYYIPFSIDQGSQIFKISKL